MRKIISLMLILAVLTTSLSVPTGIFAVERESSGGIIEVLPAETVEKDAVVADETTEPDSKELAQLMEEKRLELLSYGDAVVTGKIVDTENKGIDKVSIGVYDVTEQVSIGLYYTASDGSWTFDDAIQGNTYTFRYYHPLYEIDDNTVTLEVKGASVATSTTVATKLYDNFTETDKTNFTYNVINGIQIEITGYAGNDETLVIPSEIDGYAVIKIGPDVFKSNTNLKTVVFPEGLETIERYAFYRCYNLENVVFNSELKNIGSFAFADCTSLEEIRFPNGLKRIDNRAFQNTLISKVELPDGTAEIYTHAFENCVNLASFKYPLGWTNANSQIFFGCVKLTSITVPEGAVRIPPDAFNGMTQLTEIKLPSTLNEIGRYAFYDCRGLTAVTVPKGVSIIGNGAFQECTALKDIYLSDGLSEIGAYAFYGCTALTKVELPDSVTIMGSNIFHNCTNLQDINYPMSLTQTGAEMFKGCTALTKIVVPEGITEIPQNAFSGANKLKIIELPSTLGIIGRYAFYNCTGLTEVTVPDGVSIIGNGAFQDCTALEDIYLPDGLYEIGAYAFYGCTALTKVELPDSVTIMGSNVFHNCTNLENINYPMSLTETADDIFKGCTALTKIVVPEGITEIPQKAFSGANKLKTIELPSTLSVIGRYAFYECVNITEIDIPEAVTEIMGYAFHGCTGLRKVSLPGGLENIGPYTFFGCVSLTDIFLPDSITTLGSNVFQNCTNLKEINYPMSLTETGGDIFRGCTSITTLEIPEGITEIPRNAFHGADTLKTMTIPESVTAIGDYGFYGCSNLEKIWIGENVESIGNYSFTNCSKLTIHGVEGSYAQEYADSKNIPFSADSITAGTGMISGTVEDSDGNSIEKVSVLLFNKTTNEKTGMYYTDSTGEWSFNEAQAGDEYVVRYYHPMYTFENDTYEITFEEGGVTLPHVSATKVYDDFSETDVSEFTYNVINGLQAEITSYTGNDKTVVIPSEIDGYTVKAIGPDVFNGNTSLETVVFPEGLETIDGYAFYGCYNLENVVFNSELKNIGNSAFGDCTSLEEIRFPNGIETIYSHAFNNVSVSEIVLPHGTENIYSYAFANIRNLTSFSYPLGWREADSDIFEGSNKLTSITVPEGAVRIPPNAFNGMTQLEEINMPSGLTEIGRYAFCNCVGLTEVTVPDGVSIIENGAFQECTALEDIYLPEGLYEIGAYAFYGCTALTKVELPDSVTIMGSNVFHNCTNLQDINYPMSLTQTGAEMFKGCTALTKIVVPEGITELPENAFSGANKLKNIVLPSTLSTIGRYAFLDCVNITNITIPDRVSKIDGYAFHGCTGLTDIQMSECLVEIGDYAFFGCEALTGVQLPDCVTRIGGSAFKNCANLENINYPVNWLWAGDEIFCGCPKLTSIEIPEGVTAIPQYAFFNTDSIRTVALPNTLVSIGGYAFYNCDNLRVLSLPANVTTIGDYAFFECENLGNVTMGNSVTHIGSKAFYRCSAIEKLTLSDNLRTIGENAFAHCNLIVNVTLPPRLTSIGAEAFYNTGIAEIDVPSGVSTIEYRTFAMCPALKKITLRRTVTYIEEGAFEDSPEVVIYCYNGSAAHLYAIAHGIQFIILPEPAPNGSEIDNKYIPFKGTDAAGNPFNTKLYVYEYSSLKKIEDAEVSCIGGKLMMTLDGYNTVNIPNCTLKFGKKTKLALIPTAKDTFVSAVHCKGKDALVNNINVNSEEKTLDIYVYSTLGAEQIKEYQLLQDSSILDRNTSGRFILNPPKMVLDKPFSVRVVKSDGTVCKAVKTNIKITDNVVTFEEDIKIADKIKFDVPGDIPLIGGGEVSLDFSLLPIAFEKTGDTFRIGLGCKQDLLKNESSWFNFKKFIEKQDRTLKKGLNALLASKFGTATGGLDKSLNMEVYGFVEGTISDSGEWRQAGGTVVISVTGKVSQQWQMFYVIPIVVKFTGEAGVKTTLAIGFDFDEAEMYFDGDFEITLPKLTLSGGVGVAYVADVSLYGSGSNIIKLSTKTNAVTGTLKGEMGVSLTVLCASYKKSFLKGSWQYYHSGGKIMSDGLGDMELFSEEINDINNYTIDRSYVYSQSGWLDTPKAEASLLWDEDTENVKTLQTDVYYSADPEIVICDNGLKMMVWTGDIKSRTSGNHTAVVYSVYDEETGMWTEPAIIEDDGSADFCPDVVTDGKDIYVVWMDSNRSDFTIESNLAEISASCGISAAKYSSENPGFVSVSLTENGVCGFSPKIAIVNDEVYVSWLNNSQGDILAAEGENSIYYCTFTDGISGDAVKYASFPEPVSEVTIGNAGGNASLAFVVDKDGSRQTLEDAELYMGNIDGEAVTITDNAVSEQNPQFVAVDGNNVLMWYENGNLCYTDDGSNIETILGEGYGFSPEFAVVEHEGRTNLLSVAHKDNGSEINQYIIGENVTKPVEISSEGEYIDSFSAASGDGVLYVPFTKTNANITSKSVYESTDLCMMTVGCITDIRLEDVSINYSDVTDGAVIPTELTIKNVGMTDETQVEIIAECGWDTKLSTVVDVVLPAGETAVVTVELPLDEEIEAGSEYTFTVNPMTDSDHKSDDNSKGITIGYTDLQLTAEAVKSEGTHAVLVTVDNISCIDTDATLRVRDQSENGELLASYYIGNISAQGSETVEINKTILPSITETGRILYFEVIPVEEELFFADNNNFVYLADDNELGASVNVYGLPQTVTLKGEDYSGKILIATYNTGDKLIELKQYTPTETVTFDGGSDYAYARVMWWGANSFMSPVTKDVVVKK